MKDDEVLVSVEMITYNQERYIVQALDSVLMQEVDFKFEIVVGEDCSTDNTRKVLLDYRERYPDIVKLVLHPENVGMRNNSKAVSEASSGSLIALLEGDDYWIDPNKLQRQVDAMQKHPECDLSFHAAEKRYGEDTHGEVFARHADEERIYTTSETILGGGGFCPTVSIIYRRALRDSHPDFYYDVPAGDYFLQILGSLRGGILYVDGVMAVYRQGVEGSWSSFMEDVPKREKFVEGSLMGLNKLNAFLGQKYDVEIRQRIANLYYETAIFYLNGGMYDEFKSNMKKSAETYRLDSKAFRIDHIFRKQPRLLKSIRTLKDRLKQGDR